jgi:hypothetical protein
MLIKIAHDGFSRSVGDGAWQMKEVFGVTVAGVYVTDRPETALSKASIPASGGPAGKAGYARSELITEYGTIPFKNDTAMYSRSFRTTLEERRNKFAPFASCRTHSTSLMCTLLDNILTRYGGELLLQAQSILPSISGYRQVSGARVTGLGLTQIQNSFSQTPLSQTTLRSLG